MSTQQVVFGHAIAGFGVLLLDVGLYPLARGPVRPGRDIWKWD